MSEKIILDEADFTNALGDMVKRGVSNVADRVQYGFGSQQARGRLDLSAATKHLWKDWQAYVGREAAAGNAQIKKAPTLSMLADFLQFQYGVEIGDESLQKIANMGSPAKEPTANAKTEAVSHLKSTTLSEYEALRAQFIKEDLIDEATADDITFDPRKLFPRLANVLIRHGVITVNRKNGDMTAGTVQSGRADGNSVQADAQATQQKVKKAPNAAPATPNATNADDMTSSSVTPDGHYIDAKKFADLLGSKYDVKLDDMNAIRGYLEGGELALVNRVRRHKNVAETVGHIVQSALESISQANSSADIKSNITASGNSINVNMMRDHLTNDHVTGTMMNELRAALASGKDVAEIVQSRGPLGKTAISLVNAIVNSTYKVEKAAPATKT